MNTVSAITCAAPRRPIACKAQGKCEREQNKSTNRIRNHEKNGKNKITGNGSVTKTLRVEFSHPTATAVAIAGSFNDWRPDSAPMVALANGRWLRNWPCRRHP